MATVWALIAACLAATAPIRARWPLVPPMAASRVFLTLSSSCKPWKARLWAASAWALAWPRRVMTSLATDIDVPFLLAAAAHGVLNVGGGAADRRGQRQHIVERRLELLAVLAHPLRQALVGQPGADGLRGGRG